MDLRLIEYLEIENKHVTVSIKRVLEDFGDRCYHIQVESEDSFDFFIWGNRISGWHLVTYKYENYIVDNLYDSLTRVINKDIIDQENFLHEN